jgi:hypothetical protein
LIWGQILLLHFSGSFKGSAYFVRVLFIHTKGVFLDCLSDFTAEVSDRPALG